MDYCNIFIGIAFQLLGMVEYITSLKMTWWLEGKIKKDKEKERADFGLDRIPKKAYKKGNKRYCPKSKNHKHSLERVELPNIKYHYFSSEWKRGGWTDTSKEEWRWFLDKCSECGREELIKETRKI